ncbi:hypothetical protein Val02_43610 [Virgisporangium aliadipatigenens]|uniref:DUF4132 domain-containing protein n=1 Tax=Virgisporangium aliadipatigenens TaxID=741659 RepID=A0A8J3YP65_9ACTN|nr:DUF4132 domain-containing protein [Virgisporangium aliadipatigenens]GIJ47475.1 hypothetical protein Val02_43610 [Virgisporangium aliadipatigenens]
MTWLATAGGYEVTVRSGKVVCRNSKKTELRTVPPAVRKDPVTVAAQQLIEWLERHQKQCHAEVEKWMVRSLPVPSKLLSEVWADDAWRTVLTDLVVAAVDADGGWDPDEVGFLRDAGDKGIGLVNLDGETVRVETERIAIPHPVLLSDLDDLREFAADLEVRQSLDQLFRETWVRPAIADPQAHSVNDYAGGRYAELRHLMARASSLGYQVKGGYAVCRVFEGGETVEARSWVGSDDPYYSTETGDLVFTDKAGVGRLLRAVGPVTWSEGMRMAAALYAGRVVEKQEEEA